HLQLTDRRLAVFLACRRGGHQLAARLIGARGIPRSVAGGGSGLTERAEGYRKRVVVDVETRSVVRTTASVLETRRQPILKRQHRREGSESAMLRAADARI